MTKTEITKWTMAVAVAAMLGMGCSQASDSGYDYDELAAIDAEAVVTKDVAAGSVLRVTASALNLRGGAGGQYTIVEVVDGDSEVVAIERSGQDGWVHVEVPSGNTGWMSGKYLTLVSSGSSSSTASGVTCDPARASGAVGFYQKALHDSIAFAEGTRNYSKDGYNVMFSFRTVQSCKTHPNQCIAFGSSCSTAAGRYQFLTTTWNGAKGALGLTSFEPENQEVAGQYLITKVRKVTVPQSRAMTSAEFSNAMSKLSYEWASLPPGRYGQPVKTQSQMWKMYCSLAGC